MDRFESMSAFVAVTKAGGFSAAAREVGMPLPTISRHVAELEAHLGVRLFHRSTRQVVLTEAGQNFYVVCQRLLEDLKDAEAVVSSEYRSPRGTLTVTAPMGFGRLHLQPVATEFLLAYPEINLRLMLADRVVDLVDEHVDIALRITTLADSTMIARTLGTVRMVVTASPAYLAKRGAPTHPDELTAHDCIAWSALGPRELWFFDKNGSDVPYPIRPRLTTNSAESAIAAAIAGLGLAQTTCYQAEQGVREGKLLVLMQSYESARTPISLVHASHRMLPLKLRAFIDFAAPRLTERIRAVSSTMKSGEHGPP